MHAEVISIGDEVLSGRILDTNVQWLSQRLEEIGIRVLYHSAVGDDLGPLAEAFARAVGRADVVLATGGLGPTEDDLTREALAKAVGRTLVKSDEALRQIRELFSRRQRPMPPRNEIQALMPDGARIVFNPNGTAPGIDLDAPRADGRTSRVVCLPGVPAEMKEMWADSVKALLEAMNPAGLRIMHTQIKCFGAGESQMEAMLPDGFVRQTDPIVGVNASQTTIIFRIAAKGRTEDECRAKTEPVVAVLRDRLGRLVFGQGEDELESVVLGLLRQRQKTLAVADWGSGGLVAERLGSVGGSEGFYLGSVVPNSDQAARQALNVEADTFSQRAISREAAEAMAVGCRGLFASDYGLAISRVPAIDASEQPRPFFIALASPSGTTVRELPYAGHPATLRIWTCKQALNFVRLALLD
jgi:nicotinamide-nucleotide amidase